MTTSLAALEKALVCLAAQIALKPLTEQFVESWKDCVKRKTSFPSPELLFKTAEHNGIPILETGPTWNYLDTCIDDKRTPNPQRIIACIVHGYAEEHFNIKTCSCPARKLLVQHFPNQT